MGTIYINPEKLFFQQLEETEFAESYNMVRADVYVRNLQQVIGEILEDAYEDTESRVGFAKVTWISLNKAKRFLYANYFTPKERTI